MPGYTSKNKLPYPLASDRVADYPTIARQSAEKIDTALGNTTDWRDLTISSGWKATPGHTPRARMVNGIVQIEGAVTRLAGGSLNSIAQLPHGFAPKKTQFVGATTLAKSGTASRAHAELVVGATGTITIGDYSNIDSGTNWIVPLSAVFIP